MDILYNQNPESTKAALSELWSSDGLYTLEIVESERGSSSDTDFNPDAILCTDVQPSLTLYTPTNSLVWPSLSQPTTTSYLLPLSLPSYSSQSPTFYILPSSTDFLPKQQETKQNEQQIRTKDISDESEIRCWNHNCDGRKFSSMGNYRRHLREKGGNAKRHRCQDCGRSFTRSTSRNTHRQLGTCRERKTST